MRGKCYLKSWTWTLTLPKGAGVWRTEDGTIHATSRLAGSPVYAEHVIVLGRLGDGHERPYAWSQAGAPAALNKEAGQLFCRCN